MKEMIFYLGCLPKKICNHNIHILVDTGNWHDDISMRAISSFSESDSLFSLNRVYGMKCYPDIKEYVIIKPPFVSDYNVNKVIRFLAIKFSIDTIKVVDLDNNLEYDIKVKTND